MMQNKMEKKDCGKVQSFFCGKFCIMKKSNRKENKWWEEKIRNIL